MSTLSGVKLDLNLDAINPAAENTLSDGVDVAVMVKYVCARCGCDGQILLC